MKWVSAWLRPRVGPRLEQTEWVGALVQRHQLELARAAADEGLSDEEALDAVQDGVVTLLSRPRWQHLRDAPEEARRLLLTLVRNQARNLRRRKHRGDHPMDQAGPWVDEARALDEALDVARAHVALTGCLSTLKETQRVVVLARLFDGDSGAEVAQALRMTPGAVAVTLHRAREQLRTCMVASHQRFSTAP